MCFFTAGIGGVLIMGIGIEQIHITVRGTILIGKESRKHFTACREDTEIPIRDNRI
jgi:altronate dehydratase